MGTVGICGAAGSVAATGVVHVATAPARPGHWRRADPLWRRLSGHTALSSDGRVSYRHIENPFSPSLSQRGKNEAEEKATTKSHDEFLGPRIWSPWRVCTLGPARVVSQLPRAEKQAKVLGIGSRNSSCGLRFLNVPKPHDALLGPGPTVSEKSGLERRGLFPKQGMGVWEASRKTNRDEWRNSSCGFVRRVFLKPHDENCRDGPGPFFEGRTPWDWKVVSELSRVRVRKQGEVPKGTRGKTRHMVWDAGYPNYNLLRRL